VIPLVVAQSPQTTRGRRAARNAALISAPQRGAGGALRARCDLDCEQGSTIRMTFISASFSINAEIHQYQSEELMSYAHRYVYLTEEALRRVGRNLRESRIFTTPDLIKYEGGLVIITEEGYGGKTFVFKPEEIKSIEPSV
jgi:hypothetical protein